MFKTKSLSSFIQKPDYALRECLEGPVEITGGEEPFGIMTAEYLRKLLADSLLADHLDQILAKMKKMAAFRKIKSWVFSIHE